MSDSIFESVENSSKMLKVDFSAADFAYLAQTKDMSPEQLEAVDVVFKHLADKKNETIVRTLLKLSRLPLKNPKTFENFFFDAITGGDVQRLQNLRSLTPTYAHKNLAFIGPPGIGKTHLAQAYGYECCQQGMKAYFIKMSELKEKFELAHRTGREASTINSLVRHSCLIIDEVGHCELDKYSTRMFFDLVDRRYHKEGHFNMIFTSNRNPSKWKSCFNEDDALLCALDRIFDDATVFTFKGEGYRGKNLENIHLQTTRSRSPHPKQNTPKNTEPKENKNEMADEAQAADVNGTSKEEK